jgi:triosephosphate isomerase
MLSTLDVHGVILGHSERRAYFNETDEALSAKVVTALEADLKPMLCVGETDDEREAGTTEERLRTQVTEGLSRISDADLEKVAIAYEPVWAIGTGKVATAEQAQEACAFIRSLLAERSSDAAEKVRILYGGSAKPDNAAELLALPDVDGLLIGGASLEPDSFGDMVAAG